MKLVESSCINLKTLILYINNKEIEDMKFKPEDGLKKRRQNTTDKTPQHYCENCKCKRFSPCKCMKKSAG